jgi:hypothetical protein
VVVRDRGTTRAGGRQQETPNPARKVRCLLGRAIFAIVAGLASTVALRMVVSTAAMSQTT